MTIQTYTTFGLWREALRRFRRHFRGLAALVLPGVVTVLVLSFAVATGIRFENNPMPRMPGMEESQQQNMLMAAAVPLAGTVILTGLLSFLVVPAGIVYLSHQATGQPMTAKQSFQYVAICFFPLAGSLLLAFVVNGTVAFLGLLLMIVPGPILGLLFYVWYSFVPAVVILEGEGGGGALKRSRALTREFFWKVSGVVTAPFAIEFVLVGQMLMFASDVLYQTVGLGLWALLAIVLTAALLVLLEILKLITGVMVYYDLRSRKDGLDAPMLARELQENLR